MTSIFINTKKPTDYQSTKKTPFLQKKSIFCPKLLTFGHFLQIKTAIKHVKNAILTALYIVFVLQYKKRRQ